MNPSSGSNLREVLCFPRAKSIISRVFSLLFNNRQMDIRHVDRNWRLVRRGSAHNKREHATGAVVVPVGRSRGRSVRGEGGHQHRRGDTGRRSVLAFGRDENESDVGRGEGKRQAVEERKRQTAGEEEQRWRRGGETHGTREARDSAEARQRGEEVRGKFERGESGRRGDRSYRERGGERVESERNCRRHRESFV